jgi:hypothetical protein
MSDYYFRDFNQAISRLRVSCIIVGLTRSLTMGDAEAGGHEISSDSNCN